MLHETLCPLDYHLGNSLMALWKLIEGGIQNFYIIAGYRLLNVRNLLGTFIDQQDDDMHIRMIDGYCLGHLL